MGWDESVVPDPQDPETFLRSKLDWSEAADPDGVHARLLDLHRRLLALRRARPELTDPAFAHTAGGAVGAAKRVRTERGDPDATERGVAAARPRPRGSGGSGRRARGCLRRRGPGPTSCRRAGCSCSRASRRPSLPSDGPRRLAP